MLASSGCTKSGIARILLVLHSAGALAEGVVDVATTEHIRKDIAKSALEVASASTPFGPVLQEITLPTDPPFRWEIIHPLAAIYMLSKVSPAFAAIMGQCIDSHRKQRIVIYVDEAKPGNVLRPDEGRGVNNIFWAFSTWPEWLLRRSMC